MSPYDILQMINRTNRNANETIQDVNDLIADIDNDPNKFTYELSQEVDEFAKKLNLCSLCGGEIVQIGRDFEDSEYFGNPVQEQINRYGCDSPDCSYIVD